jgi:hypothetical protein
MKKKLKATGAAAQMQTATLAQQAMTPAALPDPENASIVDRIKMNDEEMKKRMGRASTMKAGSLSTPKTATKTLTSMY